jgi:hypothetical protein
LPGQAQNESDERSMLEVQNGISFTKDSLFKMNLRFRMQNRVGFQTETGDDLDIEQTDFRIRRLRMRLDGFVLNPRFQYYIQLGFSKSDMDLDGGEVAQPIRDAILYYHVNSGEFAEQEDDWISVRKGGFDVSNKLLNSKGKVISP